MGRVKARRRNSAGGRSGALERFSTATNNPRLMGANAAATSTIGLVQPQLMPRLMASRSPLTPTPRVMAPGTSKRMPDRRGVSGATSSAANRARPTVRPCTTNRTRQPSHSMSGPPVTTPTAGDKATTAAQMPSARVRSRCGKTDRIIAMADGPDAALAAWASVRSTISEVMPQASEVARASTVPSEKLTR